MSPRIYDETGKLVYGLVPTSRLNEAMKSGVVGYANTFQEAVENPRVGAHPLIVRIINVHAGSEDAFPREVTISQQDAYRILKADDAVHFLHDFKVVFVVDKSDLGYDGGD